jgi:hypothetical protein
VNRNDPGQYWWVGVDTDRTLSLTGWIGETPEGDAAFLLLYPNGHGAAARMRQLAETLELAPGPTAPPPSTHQASAEIASDHLILRFPGFETRIPVHADYAQTARRGWGVLVIGHDGWDGRHAGLDKYLSRQRFRRIHHGRIIISAAD